MSFNNCRVCPLIEPACPVCTNGQTCVLIAQSCKICAYATCLDNAEVSAGHYTIGSTGVLGPISTINPLTSATSTAQGSGQSSSISASTTGSSAAAVTTATSSSAAIQTSAASSTSESQAANSSAAASISSQSSSLVSSLTSTPTSGAATIIGYNAMETQVLAWILMAFWIGMGIFGERRWRL